MKPTKYGLFLFIMLFAFFSTGDQSPKMDSADVSEFLSQPLLGDQVEPSEWQNQDYLNPMKNLAPRELPPLNSREKIIWSFKTALRYPFL